MKNTVTKYKDKAIETSQKAKSLAIEKAKQSASYIGENPKTALYVVAGIGLVYLGYKIFKNAGDVVDKVGDAANQLLTGDPNIDNIVSGTGGNPTNATITDQEAINYAQQLLDAMNYSSFPAIYGTDSDTIGYVFDRLKNGDDFLKIYNVFGDKDYNGYNSPPTGFWSSIDSYDKRNLVHWLKSELDPVFDNRVFNKVKRIVDKAGFVF